MTDDDRARAEAVRKAVRKSIAEIEATLAEIERKYPTTVGRTHIGNLSQPPKESKRA